MEKHIYEVSPTFNFEQLSLANPTPVQGGSYFTKLSIGDKNRFFVQLPRCKTKCGMVKTGKKIYCDLLFSNNEDNMLIQWLESLENRCQDLIYEKRDVWFQNEMDKNDIESMMASTIRLYKSGKYILVRVSVPTSPLKTSDSAQKCLIFDEQQNIKTYDDITPDTQIIPLVCFNGIKFTSKDIRLDITLSQMMLLEQQPEMLTNCMIKVPTQSTVENVAPIVENNTLESTVSETRPMEESNEVDKEHAQESTTHESTAHESTAHESTAQESTAHESTAQESTARESTAHESTGQEFTGEETNKNDLEVSEKNEESESLEKVADSSYLGNGGGLEEVDLDYNVLNDTIKLKQPNEVYMEIYRAAREKAKRMRYAAIEAYLEANNIKTKYMLDHLEDSDDDYFVEDENTDTYLAEK